MIRDWDLKEVTDGRKYHSNDLVKADCQDCIGCSDCCHDSGDLIILDPYDACILAAGTQTTVDYLLNQKLQMRVVDGIILPHLKMTGENKACVFLSVEGRCSVHAYRPGICRLFPLGRLYEGDGFSYILQVHECPNKKKTKVKVNKWLGIPDLKKYEQFALDWHHLLRAFTKQMDALQDETVRKQANTLLLQLFYLNDKPDPDTFYDTFYRRMGQWNQVMESLQ